MATKKYEIVSPVTLEDGEIVRSGVRSFDPENEDTLTFARRGVIRLVPGQDDDGIIAGPMATANAPITDPNNTSQTNDDPGSGSGSGSVSASGSGSGNGATAEESLVELVGEGPAGALADNGITTVERALATPDADLDAIDGFGAKSLQKVQAARG